MKKSMLIAAALVMPAFLLPARSIGAEDTKGMHTMVKPATTPADKAFAASMRP